MLVAFLLRSDAELTVQRDRSPNYVRLSNGDIRNSYTLKILNKSREEAHFRVSVEGLPSAALGVIGADADGGDDGDEIGAGEDIEDVAIDLCGLTHEAEVDGLFDG